MDPIAGMNLPAFDERTAFRAGAARVSRRHCIWLIVPALVVFGMALALPALRIFVEFVPGYVVVRSIEEAIIFDFAPELARMTFRAQAGGGGLKLIEVWPLLAAGTANHLFALACLLTICRRVRLAAVLAGLSAAFAIGSALPYQIMDWKDGWYLGPGYFVWCAAPLVLMAATWRVDRTSRTANSRNPSVTSAGVD